MKPAVFLVLLVSLSAFSQGRGVVSGQIRLPDGTPAAGVRVSAMAVPRDRQNDATRLENMVETDSEGRYQLNNVTPGRYYIVAGALAFPTYHPGTATINGATILTIEPGSNAIAVDFILASTPAPPPPVIGVRPVLTGKVVMENGDPPPFFLGTLYVYGADRPIASEFGEDGRKIRRTGTAAAVPVGRDGAFLLPLQNGEHSISLINALGDPLSPVDGYYVKSMTFGTTDILGRKFRVSPNSRPSITITLAAGKQPVGKE
jgi:hypothetical protein